jgi:hypothetical protein
MTEVCKNANFESIRNMINWATCTINDALIPLLFAIALVAFIWGMIQFFLNPDSEDKKQKGKSFMLWGLIALFVMISIWGILNLFTRTFEFQNTEAPSIPQLKE